MSSFNPINVLHAGINHVLPLFLKFYLHNEHFESCVDLWYT